MDEPFEDRLDLLLAEGDRRRPALDGGLASKTAEDAPRPKSAAIKELRRIEADWNDLSHQGWAVIIPEGRRGDRMLEAVEALRDLRDREQGAPSLVFRAPPEMDARRASDWKEHHLHPEGGAEEDSPLYTLILGDLDDVSAELQHVLATDTLVGRIHFADDDGGPDLDAFAAYADKVVRAEEGDPEDASPDLLFHVADDGTAATIAGRKRLIEPGMAFARERLKSGKLKAAKVEELHAETTSEMLGAAARSRPAVLLSVSHGLGPPRIGYRGDERRRRRQGSMVLGPDEILDADTMAGQPFLPGGMWFYLACFGAGTPQVSAYRAWLSQLAERGGHKERVEPVLRALPGPGERPFVATLPQAALASKSGPLAVISHLDLAWTYGFSGGLGQSESRASRLLGPIEKIVQGSRAGVALGRLMQEYGEINDDLMREYQLDRDARADGRPSPVDPVEMAHTWMLRNDLRGYILLGDPAVRLPLSRGMHEANTARPAKPEKRSPSVHAPRPESRVTESIHAPRAEGRAAESVYAPRTGRPGPGRAMESVALRAAESVAAAPPRSAYPPPRQPASVPVAAPAPAPSRALGPFPKAAPARTGPFQARTILPPPEPAPEAPPAETALSPEGAVLAMLTGDLPPRAIARRAGVPLETLWAWLDEYRDAGRSRLRVT